MILHLLLFTVALGDMMVVARPQSSAHVKFVSPLQTYSHGVEIPAPGRRGRVVEAQLPRDFLLERPSRYILPNNYVYSPQQSLDPSPLSNPEMMYPNGVFLPPDHDLSLLGLDSTQQQQYVSSPELEDDPLLITGDAAVSTVNDLFSRGELFYDKIPHVRVLRRHEEERRRNGLSINLLSSNRPESPYYRGGGGKRRRGLFFAY